MTEQSIKNIDNSNISRNGDITTIKIPSLGKEAALHFNFNLGPGGVELAGHLSHEEAKKHGFPLNSIGSRDGNTGRAWESEWERIVQHGFRSLSPADRLEVENLLDETFNRPAPQVKAKQDGFNALLVATHNKNHSIPIDVGTSELLTATTAGGAMLEKTNGQPVFGINLKSTDEAKYINKNHEVIDFSRHEVILHEFFHYIDPAAKKTIHGDVNSESHSEQRAVWFVNQYRELLGKDKRAAYVVPAGGGISLDQIITDDSLLGDKMPGGRPPSMDNLRNYPAVKSEDKLHHSQLDTIPESKQFPGLAAFANASDLFLREKSGFTPSEQESIKTYIAENMEAVRATGRDLKAEMIIKSAAEVTEYHENEPKFG